MKSTGEPPMRSPGIWLTPNWRRGAAGFGFWLLLCTATSGAEFTRTVSIGKIAAISTVRPAALGAQGFVRIYMSTAASWGNSSCRADAADLSIDDWQLYGAIMRAWKDNLSLSITVESTERIDTTDTVCRITVVAST
jgi:hypothetical protein